MSISEVFKNARIKNEKVLIGNIVAGDPDVDSTIKCIYEMQKFGVDIIKLTLPNNDPIFEDYVVRASHRRSILAGNSAGKIMEKLYNYNINKIIEKDMLLGVFSGSIELYGKEKFFEDVKKLGVNSISIEDIAYDKMEEYEVLGEKSGINIIKYLSLSVKDRIKECIKSADEFVQVIVNNYDDETENIGEYLNGNLFYAKMLTDIPLVFCGNINSPECVRKYIKHFDGTIVSNPIAKILGRVVGLNDTLREIGDIISSFKIAIET